MLSVSTERAKQPITVNTYSALNQYEKSELRKMWLHATDSDTRAIGWLPVLAFDTRADNDEILTVTNNGDLVGWSMNSVSKRRGVLKLYQIWVRPDARILEHGRALVARLKEVGGRKFCYQIEAWVAEDLPANLFWAAIGFTRSVWRWGRGPTPRRHFLWTTQTASVCDALPKSGVERHVTSGEKE